MNAFRLVIYKHAPLVKASRKQKRILQNPWLTKGLFKQKQKCINLVSYTTTLSTYPYINSILIN